jgi:hypothetical protein
MRNQFCCKRLLVGEPRPSYSSLDVSWRKLRKTKILENKPSGAFGMQFAWNALCQKFWIG